MIASSEQGQAPRGRHGRPGWRCPGLGKQPRFRRPSRDMDHL